MERIFEQMTSWLKDWMIDGLMSLLTGVFDSVFINAIMPLAGMILT